MPSAFFSFLQLLQSERCNVSYLRLQITSTLLARVAVVFLSKKLYSQSVSLYLCLEVQMGIINAGKPGTFAGMRWRGGGAYQETANGKAAI